MEPLAIDFPPLARARLGRSFLARLAGAAARAAPAVAFDPDYYRALFRREVAIDFAPAGGSGGRGARGRRRACAPCRLALAGHAVDGVKLFGLLPPGFTVADLTGGLAAGIVPQHLTFVLEALEAYRAWFAGLYAPAAANWDDAQLEYRFTCPVVREGRTLELSVDEHTDGRLDWYAFDLGPITPAAGTGDSTTDVRTIIPAPAEFAGMPNPRWWQFEDAAVDLGTLRADATDAAKIVVAEFALLFGNNWFVVPYRQPVGSLAELEGAIVTDVFGWRTLVSPATGSAGLDWTAWDLFSLSPRGTGSAAAPLPQHLFLPPALAHVLDGDALESVAFVRDETADMVWAVEQRIPDGLGGGRDGTEAGRRLRAELGKAIGEVDGAGAANAPALRYRLGTEVPENWIPFVPVAKAAGTRAIRLQRAAMPRFLAQAVDRVRPWTSILRPGLEDPLNPHPYFVNEEEVSRAGVVVSGALRRARRFDGRVVVWHGRRVASGRGEGESGLRFDLIEERTP